jgi:hypothetical protein
MKKILVVLAVLAFGTAALAATPERYLHVRVDDAHSGQKVRINVPLSLAEKVIPAINHGRLRDGKVHIGHFEANGVDVKQILDALKTAPDGEFVTIEDTDQNVRVAKRHGNLIVHVVDRKGEKQNVDVTVPWAVAEALASNTQDQELNVEAAIQALQKAGDMTLVTVTGDRQTVRVWIDSNSTAQ